MTLDEAIDQARTIQRDLDAGRLTVPWPDHVKAQLVECLVAFTGFAKDNATAGELVRRLEAPEPARAMELPW